MNAGKRLLRRKSLAECGLHLRVQVPHNKQLHRSVAVGALAPHV